MKRFMMKAMVLFLSMTATVFAATADINYVPPIQNTDGTMLLEQELDFYTFYCDGLSFFSFPSIIGNRTQAINITALTTGNHLCDLTVTSVEGVESSMSNTVNFSIGPRVPKVPTGLTITIR